MPEIIIEKPVSTRAAVAAFHLAAIQLLEAAGVTADVDISDVSLNVDYARGRIDIAKLTPDGQHIAHWLCGFSIDPHDIPSFGTPVGLPGTTGPTH